MVDRGSTYVQYLHERPPLRIEVPRSGIVLHGAVAAVDADARLQVVLDGRSGAAPVPGSTVEARFTRPLDASYRFTASVVAVSGDALVLSWPAAIAREQARRHVRMPVVLGVDYCLAGPRRLEGAGNDTAGWRSGRTLDLSGGGMSLVAPHPILPGSVLLTRAVVPGRREDLRLLHRARVVRVEQGEATVVHGLEFVDTTVQEQDALVGCVLWHLSMRAPG